MTGILQGVVTLLSVYFCIVSAEGQNVPEPVNLGQLVSTVVDLLRVRLTWPIPGDNNAPITSYTITYCLYYIPLCTFIPRISIAANSSVLITDMNQTTVSYTLQSGVGLNGIIAVNITATNHVGEGTFVNGPVSVPVATTADATPTNITTSALTPTFAVVVWSIPPTAMGADIEFSHYMVRFILSGTFGEISRNVTDLGAILDDSVPAVEPGRPVVVTVTSIYANLDVQGAAASASFMFPRNATPIFPGVPAVVDPQSSTRALISWRQTTNTVHQTGYVLRYTNVLLNPVPSSRTRTANSSETATAGLNSSTVEIITCPFSSVTVQVDAVYEGGMTAPVVEPVTFQSAEDLPSKPRSVVVTTNGPQSLLVTWLVPSPTNGIITNYVVGSRISTQPVNQLRRDSVNSNATTFTVTNLEANTSYIVVVLAETSIGEGEQSDNAEGRTLFVDVPEPVNLGQLVSTVVDLLRVRLTWPIPGDNNAPITSYTITYCPYYIPLCTFIPRISIAANSSDLITGTNQRTVSYTLQSGVGLSSIIAVNITATNRVGEGRFVNGPVNIPVATIADATPMNIRTSALTPTFAVVVWDIPSTAMGADIEFSHYMVRFDLSGTSGEIRNITKLGAILDDSVSGVDPGRLVSVTVTSIYISPDVQGAAASAFFTFPRNATPIFPGIPAVSDQQSSTRALISWRQTDNTVHQTGYVVRFTNVLLNPAPGSRRRRASNPSGSIMTGLNSNQAEITTCPFSSVTASVDAIYEGGMTAPVVEPVTFQSAEDRPSKPRSVVASTDSPRSLLVTWLVPSPTNGIITNYVVGSRISTQPVNQLRRDRVNSNATTFTVTNLEVNTRYIVVVLAETSIGEGKQSDNAVGMTGFGVTPPPNIVVLQTAINGQFNVQFTVSRTDGPIQNFQVIISRSKPMDSTSLNSVGPYSKTNRDLYVTFIGQLNNFKTSESVDIGTGMINGQYIDKQLNENTDYYIFVRVFSTLDTNLFNDSEVLGPITIPSSTTITAPPVASSNNLMTDNQTTINAGGKDDQRQSQCDENAGEIVAAVVIPVLALIIAVMMTIIIVVLWIYFRKNSAKSNVVDHTIPMIEQDKAEVSMLEAEDKKGY